MGRKKKIFGIGMGRTGTSSLCLAMKILGYQTLHAPKYIDDIKPYDFIDDIAIAWRFKFLDIVYSGSKFILTTREMDGWLRSSEKYDKKRGFGPLRRLENRFMMYGAIRFDKEKFIESYQKHHMEVYAHFKDRPNDLLVMDLTQGDGWDKLCCFLNKPIPDEPFPHRNKQFG